MSKFNYEECRELLYEINTGTYDKTRMDGLLKLNNCDLESFRTGIARQAFQLSYINSLQHASKLKRHILSNALSECELEIALRLNDVKNTDHLLFELEKFIRKRRLVNEYKARYRDYRTTSRDNIASVSGCVNFLDILKFHSNSSTVYQELRKELAEKLAEIDCEKYDS